MQCFERVVLHHLKAFLRALTSISLSTGKIGEQLMQSPPLLLRAMGRNCYVRTLFVDFSLAFNTILPNIQIRKLTDLDFPTLTCNWIGSFLMDRRQWGWGPTHSRGIKKGKEDPASSIPPWQQPLQPSALWQEIQSPEEPYKWTIFIPGQQGSWTITWHIVIQ